MITVPAEIEREWRAGNQQALIEFLKDEMVTLFAQVRDDFNAQYSAKIFTQ